MTDWDQRFLDLAEHIAQWSKDPSTKTGAVIVAPDRRIVSLGYNGFPRGYPDWPEIYADRERKYKIIVHCERNAMLFAREPLVGCTLYTWPLASCSVCAAMVVQTGIKRCVAPKLPEHLRERWGADISLSKNIFEWGGVELVEAGRVVSGQINKLLELA